MRLIDADALVERMATVYHDTDLRAHYTEIMRAIMEQPTVDAVPVVRCKDCVYRHSDTDFGKPCNEVETRGIWFCAYGKRRDMDES